MTMKKSSMSFPKTPDDVRMTIALGHYIKAQLDDGVASIDIIVALEESLKSMEILHDQFRQRRSGKNQLPISSEVSELLTSISRKAGESLARKGP